MRYIVIGYHGGTAMTSPGATIVDLIEAQAVRTPDAPAIGAPGRSSLTYHQLQVHLATTGVLLASRGIGRGDRVAIVLPAGPELATAVLAVAAVGVSAPLNPEDTAPEFSLQLERLRATVLLTQAGAGLAALEVARSRGCPIIELEPAVDAPAGLFSLFGKEPAPDACTLRAEPSDVAMVLPTSGTTARPKIVPLTHANLCAAATNIQAVLRLDANDINLNVMPLFHIHGFSALLSTLISGGLTVCAPGFFSTHFFDWLDEYHPTWYTAAPTIHQAILARAAAHRAIIDRK